VCRVQNRLCLLPIEHVVEAMRALPIEKIAGAPPYVRGLSIVRGVPTPVVDVARLLDCSPAGEGECKRFVMFKGGRHLVALAVDDVVGVRSVSPDTMRDLPPLLKDAGDEVIGSIGTLHAELFLALRGTRLVPDDSWFTPSVNGPLS
jgi:purine-binding chemotaxis protein CheW